MEATCLYNSFPEKCVLSNDLPNALTYWPQYEMSALGISNPHPIKSNPSVESV